MQPITFERFAEQEAKHPGRRCFAQHSAIGQGSGEPYFAPPFRESIAGIFEASTRLRLRLGCEEDNWYCYLKTDNDLAAAQTWEAEQGTRVFMRDCLSCSIALDHNFAPNIQPLQYTRLGRLEHDAKQSPDNKAISELVELFVETILSLPLYGDAGLIAAVPPMRPKDYDLPSTLAARIAEELELEDLTPLFIRSADKQPTKDTRYEERWAGLEQTGLSMRRDARGRLAGQSVILIDDKYQSGITANYVGMVLQRHDAASVYGLYAVKTWGDRDNS